MFMLSTKIKLLLLVSLILASGIAQAQDGTNYIPMSFVSSSSDNRAIDGYVPRFPNNINTRLFQESWMDPANTNRHTVIRQAYISYYGGAGSGSNSCAVFVELGIDLGVLGSDHSMSISDEQTNETVSIQDVVDLQEGLYTGDAVRRYVGKDWVSRSYYVIALNRSNKPASCSPGASFAISLGGSNIASHIKIVSSAQ